jgi:uncharacterized membrane protein
MPGYRLIDLGPVPGVPATGWSRAFGLNSRGDVVGEYFNPGSGQRHAFVWSFQGNFGLLARTMTDLNVISAPPVDRPSLARDINVQGQIAGHVATDALGVNRAYLWSVSGGAATALNLGVLGMPNPSKSSEAWGVSDGLPAMVVGWSGVDPPPGDPKVSCNPGPVLGFRRLVAGGPMEALLPPLDVPPPRPGQIGNLNSHAFAVNDFNQIVGDTYGCSASIGVGCFGHIDAAHWTAPASGIELAPLVNSADPGDGTHQAFGINDAGNIVGYGWADPQLPPYVCGRRATYWESRSAQPFSLGGAVPDPLHNETIANAIRSGVPGQPLQVVGQSISAESDRAWMWQGQGTQWTSTDLNTTLPDTSPSAAVSPCGWGRLTEATDINDSGWIVGRGDRDSASPYQERAFLLVPLSSCLADLNHDCVVNTLDLGILLSNWDRTCAAGGCSRCNFSAVDGCLADLNCDGIVNSLDLGILLSSWTLEPGATCGPECPAVAMK